MMRPLLFLLSCLPFLTGESNAQGPCNVPLPASGETVTWSLAGSPYQVCVDLTIPSGGTVLVQPGVVVEVQAGRTLFIDGTLRGAGGPSNHVRFQGSSTARVNVAGRLDLGFATFAVRIEQASGGVTLLSDVTLEATSGFELDQPYDGPIVLRMDRCLVNTAVFQSTGQVALRDVTFTGVSADLVGYSLVDELDVQGGTLVLYREYQPMHVDHVRVSGANGPGLHLKIGESNSGTDYFLGTDVQLVGNTWPVHLDGSGLVPGTRLPATGNVNDVVRGPTTNFSYDGRVTWPDVGLPYLIEGTPDFSDQLDIRPGVTVEMAPGSSLLLGNNAFSNGQALRGLPGEPIRFRRADPNGQWFAFGGGFGSYLFDYLEISGAGVGVSAPQAEVFLNESTLSGCVEGVSPSGLGNITVRGTRFLANQVGAAGDPSIVSSGGLDLVGLDRPNSFEGNLLAVDKTSFNSGVIQAGGNWWNHASGPHHPVSNPGGQGDEVDSFVDFSGWRQAAPDLSDTPPVVRLAERFVLAEAGDRRILQWTASDDGSIASQTLLLDASGGGNHTYQPIATLAGDARTYEWVVPDIGFNTAARPILLRLEVTDDAGQKSFDELAFRIPEKAPAGNVSFNMNLEGSFEPGFKLPFCWTALGVSGGLQQFQLVLDNDGRMERWGGGFGGTNCLVSPPRMPMISTDRARFALLSEGNNNRDEWYFSRPFAIRPSALLGDAPPQVRMTYPTAGVSFRGGDVVPITWTASDDEAVREIRILASTNGGRTFDTIAEGLPGDADTFFWKLPASAGIADLRLRVVAIDLRFQDSSDGDDARLRVRPGNAGPPVHDLDRRPTRRP